MSLAVDSQEASNLAHHSATSPLTWSFTNTAGNLLRVGVVVTGSNGAASIGTVSYNGVSMSLVKQLTFTNTESTLAIYELANPATGAHTVSVAGSAGTLVDILGAAISFSGAGSGSNTASALDETGASTTATVNLTGTKNGSIVTSLVATGSGVNSATAPTTMSASANVSFLTEADNIGLGRQSSIGGTVTATYSVTADFWGIIAAEVFAAGGFDMRRTLSRIGTKIGSRQQHRD